MAFQRAPNTAEITVIFDLEGRVVSNIYHAQRLIGYAQVNLDNLAVTIDTIAASGLMADLAADMYYVRTEVRGLDKENDL